MSSNAMVFLRLVSQDRSVALPRRNGWPFVSIPLAAFIPMCEGPKYRPLPDGLSAIRKRSSATTWPVSWLIGQASRKDFLQTGRSVVRIKYGASLTLERPKRFKKRILARGWALQNRVQPESNRGQFRGRALHLSDAVST